MGRKREQPSTKTPRSMNQYHYYLLTGDQEKAILLDKIIFFAKFGEDAAEYLDEQVRNGAIPVDNAQIENLFGWVTLSAAWYITNAIWWSSHGTISRKLGELAASGLIEARTVQNGCTTPYRPRIGFIREKLAALGYTLDGMNIQELKRGVGDVFDNPPVAEHLQTTDQRWDAIPAAERKPPKVKTEKQKQEATTELSWLAHQKILDYAPEHIKHLSWVVYQETGHEPNNHKRTWVADLEALNKASNSNEAHLIAGLQAGEKAKNTQGVTLKGPRSYQGYIASIVASANKPGGNKTGTLQTGQRTVRVNNAEIISVGSRRKVPA